MPEYVLNKGDCWAAFRRTGRHVLVVARLSPGTHIDQLYSVYDAARLRKRWAALGYTPSTDMTVAKLRLIIAGEHI